MISVIVPVYKVEKYLPECLDSIREQTYHDLDIILVDDGSPDRCGEICDAYAGKDHRIRVFHTENRGLSAARNLGIEKAREKGSQYIGFVDSDDWIEKDYYETLLKAAEEKDADMVECGFFRNTACRKQACCIYKKDEGACIHIGALIALLKRNLNLIVWNKLWKTSCFETVRFPEGRSYEDVAVTYKILMDTDTVTGIDYMGYHYRQRSDSISNAHQIHDLVDCWILTKEMYEYLTQTLSDKTDGDTFETIQKLLYLNCAAAIGKNWSYFWKGSAEEKEGGYRWLEEMRLFSKEHFPLFGNKGWLLPLRTAAFFSRSKSKASLFLMYWLNQIRRRMAS